MPIAKPLNPDCYSFYVCTGKHKHMMDHLFGFAEKVKLTLNSYKERIHSLFASEMNLSYDFLSLIKLNNRVSRKFSQKIQHENVRVFKIEDLGQLPKILAQIES